jgi:hypothetical protein
MFCTFPTGWVGEGGASALELLMLFFFFFFFCRGGLMTFLLSAETTPTLTPATPSSLGPGSETRSWG